MVTDTVVLNAPINSLVRPERTETVVSSDEPDIVLLNASSKQEGQRTGPHDSNGSFPNSCNSTNPGTCAKLLQWVVLSVFGRLWRASLLFLLAFITVPVDLVVAADTIVLNVHSNSLVCPERTDAVVASDDSDTVMLNVQQA